MLDPIVLMVEKYLYMQKDISILSVTPTPSQWGRNHSPEFKMAADLSATEKETLEALMQASIK